MELEGLANSILKNKLKLFKTIIFVELWNLNLLYYFVGSAYTSTKLFTALLVLEEVVQLKKCSVQSVELLKWKKANAQEQYRF